ncbi:hypothetical protein Sjap_005799 [Stephania japonica]|uniref:Uncharacterized protein n=1 Tax=Stephania japonica TaxID=461633 RepID=A0AAP0K4X6_9MAGN
MTRNKVKNLERRVVTSSGSSTEDSSKGGGKIGWRSLSKPMTNDHNVWIPRTISGSTSSDDSNESLKALRGLKSSLSKPSTMTTCSDIKTLSCVDNLNAKQVHSSCSSSSNDDYNFLKAEGGVKNPSRSFSKLRDGKVKKNKTSGKAKKKKKNLKQGNDLNLKVLQLSEGEKHARGDLILEFSFT